MGLAELVRGHKAQENAEFGPRKKLIGDCVGQAKLEELVAKSGKRWLVLKVTAIHVIPDPKGRETTVQPGDEIAFFYDPEDQEKLADLFNDLFTAGIEYDKEGSDEEVLANMISATADKLMYVRAWAKKKTDEQIEKNPEKGDYFQNQKVLSKSKITEENSVPQMPF